MTSFEVYISIFWNNISCWFSLHPRTGWFNLKLFTIHEDMWYNNKNQRFGMSFFRETLGIILFFHLCLAGGPSDFLLRFHIVYSFEEKCCITLLNCLVIKIFQPDPLTFMLLKKIILRASGLEMCFKSHSFAVCYLQRKKLMPMEISWCALPGYDFIVLQVHFILLSLTTPLCDKNFFQGKKVSGNDVSAVNLQRKRRYRWVCSLIKETCLKYIII